MGETLQDFWSWESWQSAREGNCFRGWHVEIMLFKFVYENITGYIILMDRHPLWSLFVELEALMLSLAVGCLHDWCREDRALPLNSFNSVLQSNGTTSSSSHLSLQRYPNHLTKTHLNFPNIQRNHTPKDSEPAETKTLCR